MGRTVTSVFTSDGTWNSGSASAVFMTMVGGGAGSTNAGDSFNDNGPTGGAGSGELVVNRLIAVDPNTDYAVVIGVAGLGATSHGVAPTPPTASTFHGFSALGAGSYRGHQHATDNSGAGGGCGGSVGLIDGAGFIARGSLEASGWSGGAGGGGGPPTYASYSPDQIYPTGANGPGVSGGVKATAGPAGGGAFGGPGGAGAGSLWGGTDGAAAGNMATADPTHYGAGAGGSGVVSGFINGGNGAPGYVLLMTVQ